MHKSGQFYVFHENLKIKPIFKKKIIKFCTIQQITSRNYKCIAFKLRSLNWKDLLFFCLKLQYLWAGEVVANFTWDSRGNGWRGRSNFGIVGGSKKKL